MNVISTEAQNLELEFDKNNLDDWFFKTYLTVQSLKNNEIPIQDFKKLAYILELLTAHSLSQKGEIISFSA